MKSLSQCGSLHILPWPWRENRFSDFAAKISDIRDKAYNYDVKPNPITAVGDKLIKVVQVLTQVQVFTGDKEAEQPIE